MAAVAAPVECSTGGYSVSLPMRKVSGHLSLDREVQGGPPATPSNSGKTNKIASMLDEHSSDPTAARMPRRVAVIGGGAFGTAMATVVARNGHEVWMHLRDATQCETINTSHLNPKYAKEYELPPTLRATLDLKDALEGACVIFLALPAQRLPEFVQEVAAMIPRDAVLCSVAKGLYLKTRQFLSDAILEALDRPNQPFTVLSGPSFADLIMKSEPTTVAVASRQLYHAVLIQRLMSSLTFRVYTSQDVVGVELGGALKNPLAVGAGMVDGMGFGINTMSAYVTRSCAELTTLAVAMGGKRETISGLSGVGDLMLTAFGSLSRNRTCGIRLCKGEKLEDILKSATVEGVPTAAVAVHYADMCGLELPIFRTVQKLLDGSLTPEQAGRELMSRPLQGEFQP